MFNAKENSKKYSITGKDFSANGRLNDVFKQRSEAAQEIISRKPAFIEKWALIIFLIILCLLFISTWFIYYPDIIQTHGNLTADNAPREIITLQQGRLIKLFVKNGDHVKKGDMIAWIESTANTNEVLDLSKKLDSSTLLLSENKPENVSDYFDGSYQNLGEVQAAYQTFITALQQYNDYLVNGFYAHKKLLLLNDLTSIRKMDASIEQQADLTKQDEDLSRQSFEMNETLFKEKIISADEYRNQKSKLVNKQISLPQLNANILSNQNAQRDKLKDLEQLQHDLNQQKITFEEALQTLKSSVHDWIRVYTINSSLEGTIFFVLPLQQNKFVEQGKLLGYINPPGNKFYVQTYLPQTNFGKASTGMQVQIRFDAYPYQEAGFVKGELSYISPIATDSGFLATVQLSNGLETNLNKSIQYKNGLTAQVIVITKNMRLLQRLYYSFVKGTSPGK